LVQHELPEADILAEYLTERRSRKVAIEVPQRQTKAELIEMVERNAQYELVRTQKVADRNAQAMQDLAEILDLPDQPKRIEGYDISHIQGPMRWPRRWCLWTGCPPSSTIAITKSKILRCRSGRSDDFASMAEVIRRRFRRYAADPHKQRVGNPDWPDVVMIDGGKGQLSAVVEVLREMNLLQDLNVVSLAKKREEIFLPGESIAPQDGSGATGGATSAASTGRSPPICRQLSPQKSALIGCGDRASPIFLVWDNTAKKNCWQLFAPSTTFAKPRPISWPRYRVSAPIWPNKYTNTFIPAPRGRSTLRRLSRLKVAQDDPLQVGHPVIADRIAYVQSVDSLDVITPQALNLFTCL
jgi:hypothetical protein